MHDAQERDTSSFKIEGVVYWQHAVLVTEEGFDSHPMFLFRLFLVQHAALAQPG